jgi:Spy/CpxP family protein refolding chaperone
MKNRKYIIALLAAGGLLAFGPAMLAQNSTNTPPAGAPPSGAPAGPRGPSADRMLQRMTTQLNLTPDEQAKIKPIIENQIQQMNTLRQDTTLTPAQRRSEMMALRQQIMTNMQSVLTSDQYSQYQQMMTRRRPMMSPGSTNAPAGGGFGGGQPGGPPPANPPQQ